MSFNFLVPDQWSGYDRDGCLVIRNFCSPVEISKLYAAARQDEVMSKNALDLNDQSGKKTRLSLRFAPGKDIFGYFSRSN